MYDKNKKKRKRQQKQQQRKQLRKRLHLRVLQKKQLKRIAKKVLKEGLPEGIDLINVNIPSNPENDEIIEYSKYPSIDYKVWQGDGKIDTKDGIKFLYAYKRSNNIDVQDIDYYDIIHNILVFLLKILTTKDAAEILYLKDDIDCDFYTLIYIFLVINLCYNLYFLVFLFPLLFF